MRKGQSAMEYLMTYGWAILIVIVISAVLVYYGLFKPPVGKSISGFGSVMPLDMDYSAAGALKLYVENRAGDAIAIQSVKVDGGSALTITDPASGWLNQSMAGRGWMTVSTGVTGAAGDPYSISVSIVYYRAGQQLSSTGTFTGARS